MAAGVADKRERTLERGLDPRQDLKRFAVAAVDVRRDQAARSLVALAANDAALELNEAIGTDQDAIEDLRRRILRVRELQANGGSETPVRVVDSNVTGILSPTVTLDSQESTEPAAGAAAVIFDDEGRILLVKENYGQHRWSLPGGARENAETPEETVAREVYEETGVTVAIDYLIGEYQLDNGFTAYVFRCTLVEGTPALPATREIAEVVWNRVDDLPSPRSNVLHYAVPDALLERRNLIRRGLPRLT